MPLNLFISSENVKRTCYVMLVSFKDILIKFVKNLLRPQIGEQTKLEWVKL